MKKLNEIFIEEATDDLEIVRLSMIAELDAVNLYERMAKIAKNQNLKKVLLDVANEEKVHAEEFETLLEELDPDYEEAEEEAEEEVEDLIGQKESTMKLVDKYLGEGIAKWVKADEFTKDLIDGAISMTKYDGYDLTVANRDGKFIPSWWS